METFDPDLLRTFLAFVDGGSLARAASVVGRSPSAVTAQMQRLEEILGEPLLAPQGRGRELTPAGEDLVGHARRILAAHRDAWLSLKGARAEGRVSHRHDAGFRRERACRTCCAPLPERMPGSGSNCASAAAPN